jgi:excisionase family DNA binding protein
MDDDSLLTVEQVAAYLGMNPETIRRWLRKGTLRGFLPGGKRSGYRIRQSELDRFVAEREGKAAA